MSEKDQELLSADIVNSKMEDSWPHARSNFCVRMKHKLPDFLGLLKFKSINWGSSCLLHPGFCIFAILFMLIIFSAVLWHFPWLDIILKYLHPEITLLVFFLGTILCIHSAIAPLDIYLVDFACYLPPDNLKVSREEFIELSKRSGKFHETTIKYMRHILENSGIGNETYMPRAIFEHSNHKITLTDGREEASMVMFGAIDDLLAATKIQAKEIKILVVNCGILNPTPSLSSMVINHYKMKSDVHSFNIGGMGCSAGIIAVDMARDLLLAYPGSYALVISTEAVNYSWYRGNDIKMVIPNCFFRMGGAAILLSSHRFDRWRSKYQLQQLVRTHKGTSFKSFNSIRLKEDKKRNRGLQVSHDLLQVGGEAIRDNMTMLWSLQLPDRDMFRFFNSFTDKTATACYRPELKQVFQHICMLGTSKKILDKLQRELNLTDQYMEASRKTLERFGNTSSSSLWYQLAYLETNNRLERGDRVWQLAYGSGFKCNSVVWKAVKYVRRPSKSPWI